MERSHRESILTPSPGGRSFTLLELLIVVILMGIAATLAIPLLGGTDATRLQAAARLLMADLEFAQLESITHADDPCVVTFDQANDSYTLARSSAPSTPITDPGTNEPYVTQFGSGRAAELTGVSIQSYSLDGDDQLAFGIYGQTDQSTTAVITLQVGSETMSVQIDPTSGEPSLQGGS